MRKVKKRLITDDHLLKLCTACRINKPVDEFYNHKNGKYGVAAACKDCKREKQLKRYTENTARVLAINKRWKDSHREAVNIQARKDVRKRRSTAQGRLSQNIGSSISHALRGTKAGRKWEELVGYTAGQLKKHLERQFGEEMTWENYGSYWQVDHKIPESAFHYEAPEDFDFKRCWALSNLGPLQKIANIKKSNRLNKPFQPALLLGVG